MVEVQVISDDDDFQTAKPRGAQPGKGDKHPGKNTAQKKSTFFSLPTSRKRDVKGAAKIENGGDTESESEGGRTESDDDDFKDTKEKGKGTSEKVKRQKTGAGNTIHAFFGKKSATADSTKGKAGGAGGAPGKSDRKGAHATAVIVLDDELASTVPEVQVIDTVPFTFLFCGTNVCGRNNARIDIHPHHLSRIPAKS